jgi:hypothetical protein
MRSPSCRYATSRPGSSRRWATGSGKTFTAVSFLYRLIKFAGSRRVLFLVDRGNLGRQTLKEFQQYRSPYTNYTFTEEYPVQHLRTNKLDKTAKVTITTIQRLYSILKGEPEFAEENEERSMHEARKPHFGPILPKLGRPGLGGRSRPAGVCTVEVGQVGPGNIRPAAGPWGAAMGVGAGQVLHPVAEGQRPGRP